MLDRLSGATRLVPVIGQPIAQVKSPANLTRMFAARGVDIVVVPMNVAPADVAPLLDTLSRIGNVVGVIATVPHKFTACAAAQSASERARILGAANVLRRTGPGQWHADMLDGQGFAEALKAKGCAIRGSRALLVGAGGAGSAIALELLSEGARELIVHDVDPARQKALVSKLLAAHPGRAGPGTSDPAGFNIVVNATPLGMAARDLPPLPFERLKSSMMVGDAVTAAAPTPLIRAATAAGAQTCSGHELYDQTAELMRRFFDSP